jgi:hypothetical protein
MYAAAAVGESWVLHKSQIESREHQDDADVHHQPFPEAVPEEQQIHTDDNDCQRGNVKRDGRGSLHSDHPFK